MQQEQLFEHFNGKKALFVTTKGLRYLRNVQELQLLHDTCAALGIAGSDSSSYPLRVLCAYWKSLCGLGQDVGAVFVGFAPQLMLPLFWLYHRQQRFVAIDFFISMYDTLVCDRRKFSPNSLIAKLLHWWDAATLKSADAFVTDTKAHRDYFITEFGADPARNCVLYLQADTALYHPMKVARPDALQNRFVILYFGSVLPLQGVETVLDAAALCKARDNIHFVFVGPVGKAGVDKAAYPNVIFYDWLPQPELAQQIAMADLCLGGHFNAEIAKASRTIAGKTYIYKAMNKPVILGDNPANRELYSEQDEGSYFVPMGDAQALADRIVALAQQQ